MQKFINNVGLKPLYFRGQRSRRYQCFCLRPCCFDTLRAPGHNENVRYDKELTENVMIRQKILQQLLEWIECNLEHLFQSKISHRNLATADATSSFCSEISCMCLWENTFANEGFAVPLFLSGSPRNLCLILHSLCILIHSSHSAANLKSYSAALPVNTATVIIGISQISSLLF